MARPTSLTGAVRPVIAAAVVVVAAMSSGCGRGGGSGDIAGKSVRYQVEYIGSPETGLAHRAISIDYSSNEGIQEQRTVGLPWTVTVGNARPGLKPSVKAQFYGFGTIICRILIDDRLVQHKVSTEEPYPMVECRA